MTVNNNICIYTQKPFEDATLTSGDHIFLAAIGGKRKLPKSFVSHEVNNFFSKLEKRFSRDSIISISRQFEGPGKRGSLNENKASKSNIFVMESLEEAQELSGKYSLGYIKLAKPFIINHFSFQLDNETVSISLDQSIIDENMTQEKVLTDFVERAKMFNEYTLIEEAKLPPTLVLFGESEKRWFLAVNDKKFIPLAMKEIDKLRNAKSVDPKSSKENSSQVMTHQHYKFDLEEYNRIIAKMAFNFLALEKGSQFVLNSKFDLIRNWIFTGHENNKFVTIIERNKELEEHLIPYCPDRAHYIIIIQSGSDLFGIVSLYGESYSHVVKFAELESDEIFIEEPLGFICDWKNSKEYTLPEHFLNISKVKE